MTPEELEALRTYIQEQRRHLMAQVAACERMLAFLAGKQKVSYNIPVTTAERNVTVSGIEHEHT